MRHPPLLTRTYLLPALLLNPVLVLHSLNTMLAHALPTFSFTTSPPTSWIGAPVHNPVLDMHASDQLCWSYTLVMVCAQLVAFGRVSAGREERRELREERLAVLDQELRIKEAELGNGWSKGGEVNGQGDGEVAEKEIEIAGSGRSSSDEGIA